jgi:hypothetical protein
MNEIHDHRMTPTNGRTSVIGSNTKSSRNKAIDRKIHQVICNEVALVDRCGVSSLVQLIKRLLRLGLFGELGLARDHCDSGPITTPH